MKSDGRPILGLRGNPEQTAALIRQLLSITESLIPNTAAVIVGDYGKGVVTQPLLDELKGELR